MNNIEISKLASFAQGVFYPVIGTILAYIIANLGGSGLVSAATATVICGVLSIFENAIQAKTGKVLFGVIN